MLDKLLGRPDMALTEAEWNASDDALDLLYFVRPGASKRRLRLFACACGHLAWPEMRVELSKKAIEVSERFANGIASERDLQGMIDLLHDWDELHPSRQEWSDRYRDYIWVVDEDAAHRIAQAALHPDAWQAAMNATIDLKFRGDQALHQLACVALRDIFPYPFHVRTRDASWLTPGVVAVVRALHLDRSFQRMWVLADELEKAGCRDTAILNHCRSQSQHVVGCWVLGLLSAKS